MTVALDFLKFDNVIVEIVNTSKMPARYWEFWTGLEFHSTYELCTLAIYVMRTINSKVKCALSWVMANYLPNMVW